MLTAEENAILTKTDADTPMGEYFRRYWQPIALSEELPEPDSDPLRVTVMGEELVAFRDTNGRVGLMDRRCPHRGADLFFGRNEECGLRCVYHGWKASSQAAYDHLARVSDTKRKQEIASASSFGRVAAGA